MTTTDQDHQRGPGDDDPPECLPADSAAAAGEHRVRAGGGSSAIKTVAASFDDVLDHLLDQLQRRRQRATAGAPTARRAARVARLYEQEARVWSLLFERSQSRIYWRAALSAEVYARSCARAWRAQATADRYSSGLAQSVVHEGECPR